MSIFDDASSIMNAALHAALPDTAVEQALHSLPAYSGRLILIAVGKAAWQMAAAAHKQLGDRISGGVVITKYDHARGPIGPLTIWEAVHPVPDENSYQATQVAIEAVSGLRENDMVLFLLSGGGSALFEKPLIPPEELEDITRQLLACGADITNQHPAQAILRRQGRQVCPALRPGSCVFHRSVRRAGRPVGYDRLRPHRHKCKRSIGTAHETSIKSGSTAHRSCPIAVLPFFMCNW